MYGLFERGWCSEFDATISVEVGLEGTLSADMSLCVEFISSVTSFSPCRDLIVQARYCRFKRFGKRLSLRPFPRYPTRDMIP